MSMLCDWIKPGEFSYCTRCGDETTCRAGDQSFMCTRCLTGLLGQPMSEQVVASIGNERAAGAGQHARRAELAERRRAEGLRPKFWMMEVKPC